MHKNIHPTLHVNVGQFKPNWPPSKIAPLTCLHDPTITRLLSNGPICHHFRILGSTMMNNSLEISTQLNQFHFQVKKNLNRATPNSALHSKLCIEHALPVKKEIVNTQFENENNSPHPSLQAPKCFCFVISTPFILVFT